MDIQIVSSDTDITEGIRSHAQDKATILLRHAPKALSLSIRFHHEGKDNFVIHGDLKPIMSDTLEATIQARDLYQGLDELIRKLDAQLTRWHEKRTHKH